jgi:sporulation protein YlmC with PRC-barrel domain
MRSIQVVGVINGILGVIWLIVPLKFYSISMKLFTPEVSPPFDIGAVRTLTFFMLFPSIILFLNGGALFALGKKMERVPEIKVFSESGKYIGMLKGVEIEEGEVEKFEIEDKILDKDEVIAVDDVVIVKEEEPVEHERRHEFIGKEVYTKKGIYLGKVDNVNVDSEGKVLEFTASRGSKKKVFREEDIETSNDVIILKS